MKTALLLLCLTLAACTDEASRPTPPDCPTRRAVVSALEAKVATLTTQARKAVGEEAATLAWTEVELARVELYRAQVEARGCL